MRGRYNKNLMNKNNETIYFSSLDHDLAKTLLFDRTRWTKAEKGNAEPCNIIWGTNDYPSHKESDMITFDDIGIIKPRSLKTKEEQKNRAKDKAEVFTPSWVCNAQNNLVDEAWFGRSNVFNRECGEHLIQDTEEKIAFSEPPSETSTRSWIDYVMENRLEITCGEAPYLVNRYDSVTGVYVTNVNKRVGLLDRKLRVVSENTNSEEDWIFWSLNAVKSVYGYEWQGDNLFLARTNVLLSVIDFFQAKFHADMDKNTLMQFAEVISWNLWQMDGLKMVIPNTCHEEEEGQADLFGNTKRSMCMACRKGLTTGHNGIKCIIRDWKKKDGEQNLTFETLIKKGKEK